MRNLGLYLLLLLVPGISIFAQKNTQADPITGTYLRDKLSPTLQFALEQKTLTFPLQLSLEVFDGREFGLALSQLDCGYGHIKAYPRWNAFVVELNQLNCLYEILANPLVHYANLYPGKPLSESGVYQMNLSINQVNLVHAQAPYLDGDGLTVSIKEPLYDIYDLDLRGRHLPSGLESSEISNHATDMATIVAGAGNTSILGKGVASGLNLSSSNFLQIFPDSLTIYQELGISVQNHSYGTEIENFYGLLARAYDMNSQEDSVLLHVFSSGNSGLDTSRIGTYQEIPGFANLTGNFKMAKNVLTVGFLDDYKQIDARSSRGPAYDGRIKPELVAYSLNGSSNAAALTSGVISLLQQSFQLHYNRFPASALMKSIVLNSADDVAASGPDFISGFGNLNAYRALSCIEEQRFVEGSLPSNDSLVFMLEVPHDVNNLRITLTWNDPAATTMASTALVNDLDLKLFHPASGQEWHPWVLNPFPHPDSLQLPAKRTEDHLNTVEQISLSSPEGGLYQVKVRASELAGESQRCYISYQWETEKSFIWTFPTERDNMPMDGENLSAFRWENTYEGEVGTLEYSLDGGVSWQMIEEGIDLEEEQYVWEPPEVWSAGLVRMSIADTSYLSDSFSISRPLRLRVGFDCEDSLLFYWSGIEGVETYRFYTVGEKYVTPITETTDTFIVIQKSAYPEKYFTVAPQISSSVKGMRSLLLNYENQAAQCYLRSFSASVIPSEGVDLLFEIGTTYGVQEIMLERWTENKFQGISSQPTFLQARTSMLDTNPEEGLNIYRGRIRLTDGRDIVTEPDTVYFLNKQDVLIFPNPVSSQEELNVFTRHFDNEILQFYLFNEIGQLLFQQELDDEFNYLELPVLQQGLYIYRIVAPDLVITGKLLVR